MGPALTLAFGRHGDVEQMHLIYPLHRNKIAQQGVIRQQQLGLVAAAQRVDEIVARPRMRVGPLLHGEHRVDLGL